MLLDVVCNYLNHAARQARLPFPSYFPFKYVHGMQGVKAQSTNLTLHGHTFPDFEQQCVEHLQKADPSDKGVISRQVASFHVQDVDTYMHIHTCCHVWGKL